MTTSRSKTDGSILPHKTFLSHKWLRKVWSHLHDWSEGHKIRRKTETESSLRAEDRCEAGAAALPVLEVVVSSYRLQPLHSPCPCPPTPTPTPTASPPNSPQGLTHSSGPVFYVFIYHWPTIHFHKHINYSPWGRRWLTLHFTAVGGGGRRRATVGARGGGERIRYPPHSSSRYPSENDCQGFSWSLFVFGWPVDKQQVLGYIW